MQFYIKDNHNYYYTTNNYSFRILSWEKNSNISRDACDSLKNIRTNYLQIYYDYINYNPKNIPNLEIKIWK